MGRARRDQNDRGLVPLLQQRGGIFGTQKAADGVHFEHLTEHGRRKVFDRHKCTFQDTGGLHNGIQLALLLGDCIKHSFDTGFVGDVYFVEIATKCSGGLIAFGFVKVGDNNMRTPLCAKLGGGLADARRAAHDEDGSIFEGHEGNCM